MSEDNEALIAEQANDIPKRQNEEPAMSRLRASRHFHTSAKRHLLASVVLAVPVPILLALFATKWEDLKAPVAAWGILTAVINLFLEKRQKELTNKAVLIQEELDCGLFRIPWNPAKGREPALEDVSTAARRFARSGKTDEKLRNWYARAVGDIPIELGRLVCQRANCSWEKGLREKIAWASLVALFVTIATLVTLGFAAGTFADFVLLVVAPAQPATLLFARQFFEHRAAGQLSQRLRDFADSTIELALEQSQSQNLTYESRMLQNEIMARRQTAPPIPDWIYDWLREENEETMQRAAEQLVSHIKSEIALRAKIG